jgi:hypothetical protein
MEAAAERTATCLEHRSAVNNCRGSTPPASVLWKMPLNGRQAALKTVVRQRCRRGSIPPSSTHPPEAEKRGTVLITQR